MTAERLEAALAAGSSPGCGLAPYVTAGDGGLERTRAVLHGFEDAGATCVELGLPFSDPIADGPVLQAAAQRSLDAGTTVDGVLAMVARYRAEGGGLPLLAFTYGNLVVKRGLRAACRALAEAGVDGLLVPDLPVEEAGPFRAAAEEAGLALVLFAAPTTSDVRLARAAAASRGFLYVVGRTGVTGSSTTCDETLVAFLRRVRSLTDRPIGLGFGLGEAAQIAAVAPHVDLAIVGSALVDRLHRRLGGPPDAARGPDSGAPRGAGGADATTDPAASPIPSSTCDDARSVAADLLSALRPDLAPPDLAKEGHP